MLLHNFCHHLRHHIHAIHCSILSFSSRTSIHLLSPCRCTNYIWLQHLGLLFLEASFLLPLIIDAQSEQLKFGAAHDRILYSELKLNDERGAYSFHMPIHFNILHCDPRRRDTCKLQKEMGQAAHPSSSLVHIQ